MRGADLRAAMLVAVLLVPGGVHAGARNRFTNDDGAEVGGREVLEPAAEGPDGRPAG